MRTMDLGQWLEPYRTLAARVSALSQRERTVLMLAVVTVTYAMFDLFFLGPAEVERKIVRQQIDTTSRNIAELSRQMLELAALRSRDPNQPQRQRFLLLNQQTADLRGQIQQLSQNLVSPQGMTGILRRVLNSHQGLELVRLEDEPPQRISLVPAGESKSADPVEARGSQTPELPVLYRHTLVLTLRGDFVTTLRFLDAIETMPERLYWESLEYQVEEYPKAMIRIRISTLSLREGWIGV